MKSKIEKRAAIMRRAGTTLNLNVDTPLVEVNTSKGCALRLVGSEAKVFLDEFSERADLYSVSLQDLILNSFSSNNSFKDFKAIMPLN